MGYQAVTAVFAIFLVIELKEPAYIYGLLLALSFGVGSGFSLLGGKLGDIYGRKSMSLLGNLLIPLMSISVLFNSIFLTGLFFIFGWWARYFRTPVRRAWMVDVVDARFRSSAFGFLHALDVGGGFIAVAYSIIFVILGVPLKEIVLFTALPILVSSLCLVLANTNPAQIRDTGKVETGGQKGNPVHVIGPGTYRAILVAATLFGFSYYALGFPIITVSESTGSFTYGILTFGIYLGVSALAGYFLGTRRGNRPLITLWSLGYLLAAIASLVIAVSYITGQDLILYYIGAAGLGFATGSVETFEPVLIAAVKKAGKLSSRMGWLSSSRAIGLFVSNIVMGFLFYVGEFDSYVYAASTSLIAALILVFAGSRGEKERNGGSSDIS